MDKIHIGILGAGKIGTAIYNLLVISGFDYDITVADQNIINDILIADSNIITKTTSYQKIVDSRSNFACPKYAYVYFIHNPIIT